MQNSGSTDLLIELIIHLFYSTERDQTNIQNSVARIQMVETVRNKQVDRSKH